MKERPLRRLKDLPASGQRVELWWRKRWLECREAQCRQHSFTQVCGAVRAHCRVTEVGRDTNNYMMLRPYALYLLGGCMRPDLS